MKLEAIAWERVLLLFTILAAILVLILRNTRVSLSDIMMLLLQLYLLLGIFSGIHLAFKLYQDLPNAPRPSMVATAVVLAIAITIIIWPRHVWQACKELSQNRDFK